MPTPRSSSIVHHLSRGIGDRPDRCIAVLEIHKAVRLHTNDLGRAMLGAHFYSMISNPYHWRFLVDLVAGKDMAT